MLAKAVGAKLHLCHCSTEDSVLLLKHAKAENIDVTGEACPHHFTLCEDDILEDDPNYKMNPPLRAKKDLEAIRKGLKEDILDVIATDHAPHSREEKEKPLTEVGSFNLYGTCVKRRAYPYADGGKDEL